MATIFPGSASVGQIFEGYLFNGTAWDLIGNDFNPTYFSPDAPDNPKAGDLWIDSDGDVPSISNETILTIDSANDTYATKAELENLDVDLTGYLTESSASTIYATKTELDNIDLSSASAAAVAAIVDSAPSTLNTLNELAAALGDDENFATTVTTSLSNKLDISSASSTYLTQSSASSTYANMATTPISGFRNAIINGKFDIWQRGTSFTPSSSLIYTADRFFAFNNGNGSMTVSRQAFTPGNQIAGYESEYYLRTVVASVGTSGLFNLGQRIEDVRSFAGQTVTVSFWMKSDASRTVTGFAYQLFGTGGSTNTTTQYGTFNVTTSWQRFTATVTLPSISGKTIGANSYLAIELNLPAAIQTTEIWGMQVEKGSIATPFEQRPIGTELDLCRRYFQSNQAYIITGAPYTQIALRPPLRSAPSAYTGGGTGFTVLDSSSTMVLAYQTSAVVQVITVSAEL
jgi:hypothetical protein